MKVGVFGSNSQQKAKESIVQVFDIFKTGQAKVWIEQEFYEYLRQELNYNPPFVGLITDANFDLDFALSLGGDGTFLRTATFIGRKGIPIIGINTGRLGFLADIHADEIENTLEEIFNKDFLVEDRSLLKLETAESLVNPYTYALNEIAILKRETSSMISIHTYINEAYLTTYLADGLVVSTPTGSTAYSLSVNGPILVPQAKSFVLSPIAPHSLNVRPLVIPDDYDMNFEVEVRGGNFLVSMDGRSEVFSSGAKFSIKKADFTTKIIKRKNQTFYQTLRDKLFWGRDIRE